MTTTINISLNVPPTYQVDVLTRQLTEYGKQLIAKETTIRSHKRPSRNFLKGLTLPKGATSEELIEEYLEEKYGV